MDTEGAEGLAPAANQVNSQWPPPAEVAAVSAPVASSLHSPGSSSHPASESYPSVDIEVKEEEVDFSPAEETNIGGSFLESVDLLGIEEPESTPSAPSQLPTPAEGDENLSPATTSTPEATVDYAAEPGIGVETGASPPARAEDKKLIRLIQYVSATPQYRLAGSINDKEEDLELQLYVDADFAGDKENARSTSGGFSVLRGPASFFPLAWVSQRQTSISKQLIKKESHLYRAATPGLRETSCHGR